MIALLTPGNATADDEGHRTFTAAELKTVGGALAGTDVTGIAWATDQASGQVRVMADETVSVGDIARFKSAAGELAGALRIERIPGELRPRGPQGGDQVVSATIKRPCTVAFNVRIAAAWYWLMAGHCVDDIPLYFWYDPFPWPPPNPLAETVYFSYPGDDFALMRYLQAPTDTQGVVDLHNGTVQDITGAANPTLGQSVCSSGSTTGTHCGTVTGLNWSVSYADGTVNGLIRTDICSEPGDSGAPLFAGGTALGLNSGGSGNCTSGGLTFFQPVVEVLDNVGATVY